MNNQEFQKLLDHRLNRTKDTLGVKGSEYCKEDDRLKNFKDAALLNDVTPEQALWGFVTKHIVALKDFIKFPDKVTRTQWEEKIGDIICYMILLEAILSKRWRNEDVH